jgi:hypothetical protein
MELLGHRIVLFSGLLREVVMGQRLDRFREAAAECMEAAGKSTDKNAAATLLGMARKWLEVADEQEAQSELNTDLAEFNRKQMFGRTDI